MHENFYPIIYATYANNPAIPVITNPIGLNIVDIFRVQYVKIQVYFF